MEMLSMKKLFGVKGVPFRCVLNISQRITTHAGKPRTKHSIVHIAHVYLCPSNMLHISKSNSSHTNPDVAELLDRCLERRCISSNIFEQSGLEGERPERHRYTTLKHAASKNLSCNNTKFKEQKLFLKKLSKYWQIFQCYLEYMYLFCLPILNLLPIGWSVLYLLRVFVGMFLRCQCVLLPWWKCETSVGAAACICA